MEAVLITGGKDSVAMLHQIDINKNMLFFKFYTKSLCPEIESVLLEIEKFWNIKIIKIFGNSIKDCTDKMILEYNIKRIYLGVRKSDDKIFKKWNSIEVIFPVFNLDYKQVWDIINENNLPFCKLYLKGYSSLGENLDDSIININLIKDNSFLKAWELNDINTERDSRIKHIIKGQVIEGNKIGRTIGFPTANVKLPENNNIPNGIYFSKCLLNNKLYDSMSYIGTRPTLEEEENANKILEVYLFNFDRNIYQQEIEVFIVKKIRDDIKFKNIDDLKIAIENDKINTLNYIYKTKY